MRLSNEVDRSPPTLIGALTGKQQRASATSPPSPTKVLPFPPIRKPRFRLRSGTCTTLLAVQVETPLEAANLDRGGW